MNANTDIRNILFLADLYGRHRYHALSTVSLRATKQGAYLGKLKAGEIGLTLGRRDRIVEWFSSNWPEDLEWPRDVPRPSASGSEDAA
ncbi:hypothetical protein [Profundibacterium mesophilum]|uniref:Uncharacterized protein n=1 Tax=Profundibacterium mesophilum KAUST100406-0324 TaxID=1037889 RepID=A0A921TBX9_9RHOB|nr:hypothetical protein [Profundibacterium mesophilum]KAF0674401.1 hypothetical protein PMES_03297 [Profundibacterium mesophilum KAUST100406-0324]